MMKSCGKLFLVGFVSLEYSASDKLNLQLPKIWDFPIPVGNRRLPDAHSSSGFLLSSEVFNQVVECHVYQYESSNLISQAECSSNLMGKYEHTA